jgi:hypothetical protein
MNDIGGQQRRIGRCNGARERDLGLDARDAIHCELVRTLELLHQGCELIIVHIAHRGGSMFAVQLLQALAQPAYRRAAHAGGQRLDR